MPKTPKPNYEYKAKLDRVVDGDTAFLHVDLGFRVFVSIEFRLAHINAPEVKGESRERGLAATRHLQGLLDNAEILVRSDKSQDKYGRWIGDLFIADGANYRSVSDEMISSGFAVPYEPR